MSQGGLQSLAFIWISSVRARACVHGTFRVALRSLFGCCIVCKAYFIPAEWEWSVATSACAFLNIDGEGWGLWLVTFGQHALLLQGSTQLLYNCRLLTAVGNNISFVEAICPTEYPETEVASGFHFHLLTLLWAGVVKVLRCSWVKLEIIGHRHSSMGTMSWLLWQLCSHTHFNRHHLQFSYFAAVDIKSSPGVYRKSKLESWNIVM